MRKYILYFILLTTIIWTSVDAAVLDDVFKPPKHVTYTVEYFQILYIPNAVLFTIKFKERPEIFPIVRVDFGLSRERLLEEQVQVMLESIYPGCQLLIMKNDHIVDGWVSSSNYPVYAGKWDPAENAWEGFWMGQVLHPEDGAAKRSLATEVFYTYPEDLYWPITHLYPSFSE